MELKNMIVEEISVDKRIDFEEYVIKKMIEKGFNCMKSQDFLEAINRDDSEKLWMSLPHNKKKPKRRFRYEMSIISCDPKIRSGRPDLICWNKERWFMIEVKDGKHDGLRLNQLEWIKEHSDIEIMIYWVKLKIK